MRRRLTLGTLAVGVLAAIVAWMLGRAPSPPAPAIAKASPTPEISPAPFHGALAIRAAPGQRAPDARQFEALAKIADSSCRCARHKQGDAAKAECWAEFDANAETFADRSEGVTACMVSIATTCFGAKCITRDYEGFCSADEYAAAEAVRDRTLKHARTDAQKKAAYASAQREVESLIQRWDRGEQVAKHPDAVGCGG